MRGTIITKFHPEFRLEARTKHVNLNLSCTLPTKTVAMSTVATSLSLPGERKTGSDVRTQNVLAASSIANIVKTSLGPVGLDKMLVDDIGDVTITNDGATILKLLEVEHPAAKVR